MREFLRGVREMSYFDETTLAEIVWKSDVWLLL